MLINIRSTYLPLVLVIFSLSSHGGREGRHPPQEPPPEAREACVSVAINAACSFAAVKHKVEGICLLMQKESVCVPKHHLARLKQHQDIDD